MDLQGRGALVTGGSGDLGTAICRALAQAGCDVAVGYVGNRDGALKTGQLVETLGRRACAVQLDQSDASAVDGAVARAHGELGRLDVLVNNAAWNIGIPFPELDALTVEIWDRIFNTNVRGPFQLARAARRLSSPSPRHRPGGELGGRRVPSFPASRFLHHRRLGRSGRRQMADDTPRGRVSAAGLNSRSGRG